MVILNKPFRIREYAKRLTSCSIWVDISLDPARSRAQTAVNIEPAICNGHLSYPWGRRWRGEGGTLDAGAGGTGVDEAKRLGEGRVGE